MIGNFIFKENSFTGSFEKKTVNLGQPFTNFAVFSHWDIIYVIFLAHMQKQKEVLTPIVKNHNSAMDLQFWKKYSRNYVPSLSC
jgi:hypothetical protein